MYVFAALFIDKDVLFKKYYLESFASKEFRIWAEAGFFVKNIEHTCVPMEGH